MQIIGIEESLYEKMLSQIEMLIFTVEYLSQKSQDKCLSKWLDCQQVCSILKITPKTLQVYRETGKIGFSQMNRKVFYRSTDIKKLLKCGIYKI